MIAVAISPHLDDAVFSCGGLLALLSDAGWRVELATVFAASVTNPTGFALDCQLDKGLPAEVDYMALRRDEDREAARMVGASPRWLPFVEAPHRGYGSAGALFGASVATDAVEDQVAEALGALLAALSPDLVLAPQAIGGHVDHRATVRALRRIERPATVWWRDFPYDVRGPSPAEPFAVMMAGLPERVVPVDAEQKRVACSAYRSQSGFQFGGAEGLARLLGAGSAGATGATGATGASERFRVEGEICLP